MTKSMVVKLYELQIVICIEVTYMYLFALTDTVVNEADP